MKNWLKERLKAGAQTVGVWMSIPSPDLTEALSRLGFDWFVYDHEHSPLNLQTIQTLMQALGGSKAVPIVRVAWNDPVIIKRALDIGAYGVIVPWVSSREEAVNVVRACRYPPRGIRGFGPRRPSYLEGLEEYVTTADEEILILVQIETREAVENLENILSVDGIDGVFIGPMDLSASLGYLGRPFEPEVQETIDRIFEAGRRAGVITGIYGMNLEDVERRLKQGFQFVCVGSDLGLLLERAREVLSRVAPLIRSGGQE